MNLAAMERATLDELNPDQRNYARFLFEDECTLAVRFFADGLLYAAAKRLLFHYTVIVGDILTFNTYADRWCYGTRRQALDAIFDLSWQGLGDPGMGWHRHPSTERRPSHQSDERMLAYLERCRVEEESAPWRVGSGYNDMNRVLVG